MTEIILAERTTIGQLSTRPDGWRRLEWNGGSFETAHRPPDSDPSAVVAPTVVERVGHQVGRSGPDTGGGTVEQKMLDVQTDVEGDPRAVDRVIRIQELFAAGLHSKKIARLLPCLRDADGGPSEMATPKLVSELSGERDRIDRLLKELANSRAVLDEVITAASDRAR